MDLYEAIQGDAKLEIEHLSINEIDDKNGILNIMKILDLSFAEWEVSRQQEVDTAYEYLKRRQGEGIREFVIWYKRVEMECKRSGTDYAMMLTSEARCRRLMLKCCLPPDGTGNLNTMLSR